MTRQAPQWLQNPSYAAAQDRQLIGALWPAARSTGLAVTATTGMTLNVGPGQVAIPTANNTGSTLCTSDATEQVTIGAAPTTGTNRIDLVVALARGADLDGGGNDDWVLQVIAGTVAATPVAPAVPAGAVALAQVYVGGGVATLTASNITDLRPGSLSVQPALPVGALAVVAETLILGNTGSFGATALALSGWACSFTPAAGRQYYFRLSAHGRVSTSAFITIDPRVNGASGYAWWRLVFGNVTELAFDVAMPLMNVPAPGTPTTIQLYAAATAGTAYLVGASPQPRAMLQVLERVGMATLLEAPSGAEARSADEVIPTPVSR